MDYIDVIRGVSAMYPQFLFYITPPESVSLEMEKSEALKSILNEQAWEEMKSYEPSKMSRTYEEYVNDYIIEVNRRFEDMNALNPSGVYIRREVKKIAVSSKEDMEKVILDLENKGMKILGKDNVHSAIQTTT